MRIVGGKWRGQALETPNSQAIRPTTDRSRESLFNILVHGPLAETGGAAFEGARVIDLFAGTGALGLEALSRGAAFVLFVDESAAARGLIRANITRFQQNGTTKLFKRDATRLGSIGTMHPFTLAFLDPPYGKGLGERALISLHEGGWLEPGAFVVLEEAAEAQVIVPSFFSLNDQRIYGTSKIMFLHYPK